MRNGHSRPMSPADVAIKSAGAAREYARRHNLPITVDVIAHDGGLRFVRYEVTHNGTQAQRYIRVDPVRGEADAVFDTGYYALVEEIRAATAEVHRNEAC